MYSKLTLGGAAVALSLVFSSVAGLPAAAAQLKPEEAASVGRPSVDFPGKRRSAIQQTAGNFAVAKAAIESGRLVIAGTTDLAYQRVLIDGKYAVRSNAARAFAFAGLYLPVDCNILIQSGGKAIEALVQFCGPQGKQGVQGAKGPPGPPGPQGIQGAKGATGDQGLEGAAGPKGDPGPQGPQGPVGVQGLQGPQGPAGVGAGYWWYQEAWVQPGQSVPLKYADGTHLNQMFRGFVTCLPMNANSNFFDISHWVVEQYDVARIEFGPSSATTSPTLSVIDRFVSMSHRSTSTLLIRCRLEKLGDW